MRNAGSSSRTTGLGDRSRSSIFGEGDCSLKTSEAAGRSSSGVSGGGVALSPSVLEDEAGDFLTGDVYLGQAESASDRNAFASVYLQCLWAFAERRELRQSVFEGTVLDVSSSETGHKSFLGKA